MISFKAMAILGCCLHGVIILFAALALLASGYKQTKVVEDLKRYFRSHHYDCALEYLKGSVRISTLRRYLEPMIQAHTTPHRISLIHEEAFQTLTNRRYPRWWMTTVSRILSIAWIASLITLFGVAEPETHGWAVAYVFLAMVSLAYTQVFENRAKKDYLTLVMVRNALLESLDYIPPEYRGHAPRTDAEREAWREAVERVEHHVLAGKDAEKATDDELERIGVLLEQVARDPVGGFPPPNRIGMLMEEDTNAEAR